MAEKLCMDTFAPLVGQRFAAGEPGQAVTLALVSASASGPRTGPKGFSLLFRGPADEPLPQSTYPLAHPAIGSVPIFIVPVGSDAQGMQYEAIFN
jgi:hypothetical protein